MLGNLVAVLALAGPGALFAPVEPAPGDVTVAWASPAYEVVVVTWTEIGDVRNRVDVVRADDPTELVSTLTVEAGRPNTSGLPDLRQLPAGDLRVAVSVIDENGAVVSEAGLSPVFDVSGMPAPVITSVVPREDGTLLYSWRAGEAAVDTSPGDPLDVPAADPPRYWPMATWATFSLYFDLVTEPIAETSFVLPADRAKPYWIAVRTVPNEWTATGFVATFVHGTKVTATVPKTVAAGGYLTVTGKSVNTTRACDLGPCAIIENDDTGRLLRLQSWNGTAWQTVAATFARGDGRFTFRPRFPGPRQYRVVAPAVEWSEGRDAMAYFATPPAMVRTMLPVARAGG
ncbi:hypothetical protein AB0J83_43825 [Actinoplanes sp. NPDC049596]|uniref:hypothetical protein n=1 Tax=unclassified Actinoplanes TaxID=2626549 RepID=UPI0034281DD3